MREGKIVFEGPVRFASLRVTRTVRIYLPPSHESSPSKRFPVLYLHDGENAFSTAGPHAAFGWGPWNLDQTVNHLVSEKRMREIIMVAVDSNSLRYREYRGPVAAGSETQAHERYRRLLIDELKPKIDREYQTLQGSANTGVMGSSMGGICSLALAWAHPEIFGLAASLSGSFQIEKHHFLKQVLGKYRGPAKPIRVYLDSGTMDYSGGDDEAEETRAVARELGRIGIEVEHFEDRTLAPEELQWLNLAPDKYNEALRSHHNELYWRLRAWRPLAFLFPPDR